MVEEEHRNTADEETANAHSDTTWCDTDSCISASKCYCKKIETRSNFKTVDNNTKTRTPKRKSRSTTRKPSDKLAVDYELFNINGNNKSIEPDEAMSVKKSVEAAAIFADVKLSQTTDIESLCAASSTKLKSVDSCRSYSIAARKQTQSYRKRESFSIDRRNELNQALMNNLSSSTLASQKSCSADDLLQQLKFIERNIARAASIHSGKSKTRDIILRENFQNNYQSMRAVSASLEDTLGYLP